MIDLKNVDNVLQNVTGKDFLNAERQARQMGDQTASIVLSGQFQTILLANALKVPVEDIEELPVAEFVQALSKVNNFLFAQDSVKDSK